MVKAFERASMLIHSLALMLYLPDEKLLEIEESRLRVSLSIAHLVMRD